MILLPDKARSKSLGRLGSALDRMAADHAYREGLPVDVFLETDRLMLRRFTEALPGTEHGEVEYELRRADWTGQD